MKANTDFGNSPMLRGYDFSATESIEYASNYVRSYDSQRVISNKLVPILGLFCPNRCNLSCIFCSSSANSPTYSSLSRALLDRLVREAAQIGVRTLEIAAMGEPTLWGNLLFLSKLASSHDMTLVFFSNGLVFSDDELCRRVYGLNSDSLVEELYDNGASVLIKLNSNREDTYDFMAGVAGAYEQSRNALRKLMDRGFNACSPTRLGCASVVIKQNASQIVDVWRWARENHIFPFVESLQRIGKADDNSCYDSLRLEEREILEIYMALADLDKTEYGISWEPQLPYAGFPCTVFDHLVVDNNGMVRPCFKFFLEEHIAGSIHEKSLTQVILSSDALCDIRRGRLASEITAICINRVPAGFWAGTERVR